MADIDVEAVLKQLTLAEKVDLLAGEFYNGINYLHSYYAFIPTTAMASIWPPLP